MNKHVSKLLQPGVFWYCLILLAFAVAAALLDQYYLAAGELVVTVIAMVVSRLLFIRRRNALHAVRAERNRRRGHLSACRFSVSDGGHPPAGGRDHLG